MADVHRKLISNLRKYVHLDATSCYILPNEITYSSITFIFRLMHLIV